MTPCITLQACRISWHIQQSCSIDMYDCSDPATYAAFTALIKNSSNLTCASRYQWPCMQPCPWPCMQPCHCTVRWRACSLRLAKHILIALVTRNEQPLYGYWFKLNMHLSTCTLQSTRWKMHFDLLVHVSICWSMALPCFLQNLWLYLAFYKMESESGMSALGQLVQ